MQRDFDSRKLVYELEPFLLLKSIEVVETVQMELSPISGYNSKTYNIQKVLFSSLKGR